MLDNSFDEFVHGHVVALDRYALALTGDRRAADDLVQETLVRVASTWRRAIREGNPAGSATTVMFRAYVSPWRRPRRRATTELAVEPVTSTDPSASANAQLTLRLALGKLPRLQRTVLVATYLRGSADDEIAEMIGRTPATIRSLRDRALTALHTAVDAVDINAEDASGGGLESLLRAEFEHPAEHVRESVTDLTTSTRRIQRRRTIASSAAAIIAVIAVAALTTTLITVSDRGPARRPNSAPTAIEPSIFDRLGKAMLANPGLPVGGGMVDAQHGFLLLMRCDEVVALPTCTSRLDATTDGGATFIQRPPLPVKTDPIDAVQLYVFDSDHLVLDQPGGIDTAALMASGGPDGLAGLPSGFPSDFPSGYPNDLPSGFPSDFPSGYPTDFPSGYPTDFPSDFPSDLPTIPAQRWASADGGMTWHAVSTKSAGPVTTIPPGAQLDVPDDVDGFTPGKPSADVYAMTATGTTYTLAHAPAAVPTENSDAGPGPVWTGAVNGSYFLNSAADDDNTMVSTDRGATWHTVKLPKPGGELTVLGGDGHRIYGEVSSDNDSPDSLVISTDSGLTWRNAPLPPLTPIITPSPNPSDDDGGDTSSSDFMSMAVLPNGDLLLADGAQLWRLPADGQTFQHVDEDITTLAVIGFTGAVIAFRGNPTQASAYATTDGKHWTPSKIG